ncbi:hypothetical protein OG365_30860 [Streptomyces sp. NBC_00853]|uniref:hypothetical protein n=1 Tax=Streptomyces sp. NBC_00853 TaxID=2903681 RepID=UPI003872CE30|nr:hypothetical protein OG365_30860 [Streptomyces sp. NBC_00853]
MPEPTRPVFAPGDTITSDRDITHAHFAPGDQIVVIKGVADGELWGESMTVVAPSWHTPTDEDGWRVRNPLGGSQSFITAHPRHLVHLSKRCPDCLIYLRALEDFLLPKVVGTQEVDLGWYRVTDLGQLVHATDGKAAGR